MQTHQELPAEFPRIAADRPLVDILSDVVERLGQVSEVLAKEYHWLSPKVDEARQERDAEIEAGNASADLEGRFTDLMLHNKQLDKHLENIQLSALIAADAAGAITAGYVFHGDGRAATTAQSDVSGAIAQHLAAVHTDEAMFDDKGVALNELGAEKTRAAEIQAYSDFLRAPCRNAADVQAKLQYLIHGTVGERDDLISCVDSSEYGFGFDMAGVRILLASMLLDDTPSAPGATRAREDNSHTHAREGASR